MSDSVEDLARDYKENVIKEEHPKSVGLFTIPEHPEVEAERGMWSSALNTILTTLRYLAPATIITIFWGQQSFLFRILKYIDSAFRAIVFSSEEQKQAVLQWMAEVGPVKVEHLETVWQHGWILCGVLDAALPGACAGHPPTKLSIKHAQAIAEHYLGVEPVFSRQELESSDSLSRHQEWKFATYLDRIRQAISKATPPVSKPVSQRTSPETKEFSLDYVAKGSGLTAIQINNKGHFKIYPTAQQSLDPGDVTILIRGPKDTYGMAVIPPILGKAQMIRHKLLGLHSKQTYTENILPLTQGATYLRSYGKNDMNKTYYIPKPQYDIEIDVEPRTDHVKISYTVKLEGKYLVSITSRGQSIVGSPFSVTASNNIISFLEKDSFCLEDGEEIDIVDVQTDRKIVLRIVDFVTEKMLLKENGALEKISDDEAKLLMTTDKENEIVSETSARLSSKVCAKAKKSYIFKKAAYKILTMQKVCKVFRDVIVKKKCLRNDRNETCVPTRNQQGIPDIVNSTLTETNVIPYLITEKREKFIVPESISVSLRAEISKPCYDKFVDNTTNDVDDVSIDIPMESSRVNTPDSLEIKNGSPEDLDDSISADRVMSSTGNNPFLNEMFEENYAATHNFGTFIASEYETNNFQSEETRDSSITITIDTNSNQSPIIELSPVKVNNNPFMEPIPADFERPKTPVFKIISGEKVNRDESVFIDPKSELVTEDELGNEFVNPFFIHQIQSKYFDQAPITDFIIGAPVSLPPVIRATSPEPEMKSLIITDIGSTSLGSEKRNHKQDHVTGVVTETKYLIPLHNTMNTPQGTKRDHSAISSTFHSLDSGSTDPIDNSNASTTSDSQFEPDQSDSDRNVTPRRDMWDSAYVSIDDNNCSPDNNNNENTALCEPHSKQAFSPCNESTGLKQEEISNMGPAEREIWQTCNELKYDISKTQDDVRPYKWELKRPIFTPIIEESDRSISSGTKDIPKPEIPTKQKETDTISVAFAELNDLYQEYFPIPETYSTPITDEGNKLHGIGVDYVTQNEDKSVDSASEETDVKRHKKELEGTISEVQANATESVSVSQILHNKHDQFAYYKENKVDTQFGDSTSSNIVLEKKKYWDERIREIEAKSQVTTIIPKKRRNSYKHPKNDSLSKRKGKQMIKNFLSVGDYSQVKDVNHDADKLTPYRIQEIGNSKEESVNGGQKIVEKWKKFWDDKLEVEQIQMETEILRTKSPKSTSVLQSSSIENQTARPLRSNDSKDSNEDKQALSYYDPGPAKQELPEEVFRAFETSPKRFFGTSRKQIMNKIDTFLGKPAEVNASTADTIMGNEGGLVSSRISLFHNMSNTEELPWSKRKCQSLQNISQRRESEKNVTSIGDSYNTDEIKYTKSEPPEIKSLATKVEAKNTNVTEDTALKTKRCRMMQHAYKTIDESVYEKSFTQKSKPTLNEYGKTAIKDTNSKLHSVVPKVEVLRKKSFSKSEMDIFNKLPTCTTDGLDKYQSCDELPKINVKSFISLYESVSKTTENPRAKKRMCRTSSADSQKTLFNSINSSAVNKNNFAAEQTRISSSETKSMTRGVTPTNLWRSQTSETVSNLSLDTRTDSSDVEVITKDNKETTYLSLSDIELEIIETSPDKSRETTPEQIEPAHIQYKNRFKLAKEYFQSLEELREIKKPRKLNECELLLRKQSTESLENEQTNERPQQRVKKNIKSRSLPSSEIAKAWNQLKDRQERSASEECSNTKLMKISEKFNVDDLFTDVTEGKLSRQGSLRGIPHKKAVLEAFRSMENVTDISMNSYEFSDSLMSDFSEQHNVKNAQTYLKEYPYLPTTDPSNSHSRIDVKASGLISLKELKERRPRRNSVPDIRLNLNFTAEL